MKQKKTHFKKLLIFGIAFMLASCSEDLYDDTINENNSVVARKISMEDIQFKSNAKLVKSVANLKQIQLDKSNSKYEYSEVYDFYIDEGNGVYLEKDNLESYTFPVYKTETDSTITNIIFNKTPTGAYDVILGEYDILKSEFSDITAAELVQSEVEYTNLVGRFRGPELICIEEYSYENANELVGADGKPIFHWINTNSYCFWSSSDGGGGSDGMGSGSSTGGNTGGGVLTGPVDSPHGGGVGGGTTKTPCQQLKDNNSKPIANTTPPKTVLDNLNDLTSQMATNPRERMYVLTPTSTAEDQFVENYVEGPLNGGDVEMNLSNLYVSILMHCHYDTSLLSMFSLSDIYQMYALQSAGFLLNDGQTFTSYLVTAQGTKYAIRFAPQNPNSLSGYNENFFTGWEFDNMKKAKEDKYAEDV